MTSQRACQDPTARFVELCCCKVSLSIMGIMGLKMVSGTAEELLWSEAEGAMLWFRYVLVGGRAFLGGLGVISVPKP